MSYFGEICIVCSFKKIFWYKYSKHWNEWNKYDFKESTYLYKYSPFFFTFLSCKSYVIYKMAKNIEDIKLEFYMYYNGLIKGDS